MTRALIIADPQRDFCEGGSLGVAGGAAVVSRIDSLLKSDHDYAYVIATRDHLLISRNLSVAAGYVAGRIDRKIGRRRPAAHGDRDFVQLP